jgi:hypothetical protein
MSFEPTKCISILWCMQFEVYEFILICVIMLDIKDLHNLH